MSSNRIYYIDTGYYEDQSVKNLIAAGYKYPGWYFWDETNTYIYGPFATEETVYDECVKYHQMLRKYKIEDL